MTTPTAATASSTRSDELRTPPPHARRLADRHHLWRRHRAARRLAVARLAARHVAGFGVEPGLVRTAVSRLVADGWFERTRIGTQQLLPPVHHRCGRVRDRHRAHLSRDRSRLVGRDGHCHHHHAQMRRGAAPIATACCAKATDKLAANVMLRPRPQGIRRSRQPECARRRDHLVTRPENEERRDALARACWQLDELDAAYRKFLKAFGPVAAEIAGGASLTDAQAFQLRILLIHDWRRIVLRDPLLPARHAAHGLAGNRALELVGGVYRRILRSLRALARPARRKRERRRSPPPQPPWPIASQRDDAPDYVTENLQRTDFYVTYKVDAANRIGRKACTRRP